MKQLYLSIIFSLTVAVCNAQSTDPFPEMNLFTNVYAKMAIDDQSNVAADTNLIGIWKMQEDPDPHNYFVVERRDYNNYAVTYMSRGGSNRTYENFGAFGSKVGGADVFNVCFWDEDAHIRQGYFFLKVINISERGFDMTLSLIDDPELKNISDRKTLRDRIATDINSPGRKKQLHFHKILPLMYCK